ncbi:MAG: aldo/keto reductase [Cyanobacteria bacterium P01_G01_bin.38]
MKIQALETTPLKGPEASQIPIDADQITTKLPFYRPLGRTGLQVSCLGIGGGGALASDDVLYAFERGINYFFYSSDLHHHFYGAMAPALRQLCGRRSPQREQVVLATVTYIKQPEMAMTALFDQFMELGIDYVDVFFWGWVDECDRAAYDRCLQLSPDLRGANSVYQRTLERMMKTSERLKRMGAVRYVGTSFHNLDMAQDYLNSPDLDVVMVRHNAVHRTAQTKVFDQFATPAASRPGIVTFKSAGLHTFQPLWNAPPGLPPGCWQPTVPDFYRYSLSQKHVDLCLAGFRERHEIDAALEALQQGYLTPAELDYFNLYGDLHRGRIAIADVDPSRLLSAPLPDK